MAKTNKDGDNLYQRSCQQLTLRQRLNMANDEVTQRGEENKEVVFS